MLTESVRIQFDRHSAHHCKRIIGILFGHNCDNIMILCCVTVAVQKFGCGGE